MQASATLPVRGGWYSEKLGLSEIEVELDESEPCVALGFSNDEYVVALGPAGTLTDELRPLLFRTNIRKAKDFLNSRGAGLGEIEQSAQGTHYLEIRDPEGNVEVSEGP
jgi:hypothetical protein